MSRKIIFSGIQPTGIPHLGNYLGAICHWVSLQNRTDVKPIFCVVDLHSITVPTRRKELRQSILTTTACLLACGIDPEKSILFQQSAVPYHTALSWILGTLVTVNRLKNLPQWKNKAEDLNSVRLGLYTYPVLQAADILLYKASLVPVGEDQNHHIHLARELAQSFNDTHGKVFPLPEILEPKFGFRVKDLRRTSDKMSKTVQDDDGGKGRIDISDADDVIVRKVKKAVTDSIPGVTYDPENRPAVANLLDIHAALTGKSPQAIADEVSTMRKGPYKELLSSVILDRLKPIRREMESLMDDKAYLETILEDGNTKAFHIASKTFSEVQEMIGMR